MPTPSLWRDLARKAAQALRRQLAQTEQGLASIFTPARAPQAIPVPLPRRRAPRFPGDKRFYTQSSLPKRSLPRTSGVVTSAKTEFGRSLTRPRLTSGTIRNQCYGRSFSTSPVNHAQVVREVYQSIALGIRAGVLNTPYYPPTTGHHSGHVMHGVRGDECVRTYLNIPLFPSFSIPSQGNLSGATVSELDDVLCATPQYLARLRRDLNKLTQCGNFDYRMINNDTEIQLVFHGRYQEDIECFLRDIGVTSGTLSEDLGLLHIEAQSIDWHDLFRSQHSQHHQKTKSKMSLERFVDAVDRRRYALDSSTIRVGV